MRFAFINNFEQILAQAVSDTDTTITLDGGGSQMSDASADLVYVLTLFRVDNDGNETAREIVHVTGAEGDVLTVERAQEGTTAQAWAVGEGVSQRLTAGVLGVFTTAADQVQGGTDSAISGEYGIAIGASSESAAAYATALGPWASATGENSLALGYASADGLNAIALGEEASASEDNTVAIGRGDSGATASATGALAMQGTAQAERAISCGFGSRAGSVEGICVGAGSYCERGIFSAVSEEDFGLQVMVGSDAYVEGHASTYLGAGGYVGADWVTAIGASLVGAGPRCVAAGFESGVDQDSPDGIAIGGNASVENAPGGISIGSAAKSTVPGGMQVNALSYLPAEYSRPTQLPSGEFTSDPALPPAVAQQSSQQVVIATAPFDLTDDTAAVTLDLPPGTRLFVDSIDVVIVASDGAGGDPEIQVGPDDQDPADYLGSTPVTKTSVGGRESHDPLVADGVTTLRVATAVAGAGTTYQAKVVFRGYVMEL
ncbi:MAG: hypothetical protein ACQEUG_16035 [Pseudomonadota bacterium]